MNIFEVRPEPHEYSTGNYDQITEFEGPYEYDGPNSFIKIPYQGPIDFDIQFPIFKMPKKGILTSNLQCVPMSSFPLVSSAALKVFQKTNPDTFQHFEVKVSHKDLIVNYYALHFPYRRQAKIINWSKSTFSIIDKVNYHPQRRWL